MLAEKALRAAPPGLVIPHPDTTRPEKQNAAPSAEERASMADYYYDDYCDDGWAADAGSDGDSPMEAEEEEVMMQ